MISVDLSPGANSNRQEKREAWWAVGACLPAMAISSNKRGDRQFGPRRSSCNASDWRRRR
ncbi:hypothetical protein MES5069_1340011 [Mesorhizobium escarrei]|uniref:Uncharacterized protein n=1 Tax=Mesorhizobium escarrei TaxID=666018 RepID=A0ABM9DKT5_9HYPH|nr:hypothetical protein MES5069_1340011 [Mesorhizobium escarrei]